jgi:demethylmenaquinone methyltransferase / 2-methoxy-6-polyprenyl-1,4-benzoquinol methylase
MTATQPGRLPAGEVRAMFDRIAPRYDLMNRLMSGGMDGRWRRLAAAAADISIGAHALDVCTGTGDLAFELADRVGPGGAVIGVDFSEPMLERATAKATANGAPATFQVADALDLPFGDSQFDGATVAFGARNLSDLDRGLAEMARVVRSGGRVVVLEITTPRRLRALHGVWFDRVVPRLGGLVGGDRAAYRYLPASAKRFPSPPELATLMTRAGLVDVSWRGFMGGIVALHHGRVA